MSTTRTSRPEIILRPINDIDPRQDVGEQALVLASRNAYPVVAQTRKANDKLGLAAGGGIALLLGGIAFVSMSSHRDAAKPVVAPPPLAITQAPPLPAPLAMPAPRVAAPLGLSTPLPSTGVLPAPYAAQSPVMVYDGSQAAAPQVAIADAIAKPGAKGAAGAALGDNEQFAARMGGESADVAIAQQLSDPANTIAQGTLIPAVLETAIDTDLPGYVRAVVSKDVRSFDGKNVLVPRSSRLIGQYKSGLQAGQTRAYVIWQRLIRPDGASVALASPGVDFSGTSGLAGKVDSHFLKRFGSAVLLSVVGGLSAVGNASVVLSGGQSAASVAASRDSQIPPTIRVPQGQPIRIFTARDLDFSTVAPTE